MSESGIYEVLDDRFRAVRQRRRPARGAVRRLPLGRGPDLPAGLAAAGLERHPERPAAALGRGDRRRRRLPLAGRVRQRQHPGPPGPAGQLRAGQPPGDPHRARRLGHRAGRPVRGQAAEQPERRDGEVRRVDLVLRPGLRDHQRLRGPPRPRARSAPATSTGSTRRPARCGWSPTGCRDPTAWCSPPTSSGCSSPTAGLATSSRSRSATTARWATAQVFVECPAGNDNIRLDDDGPALGRRVRGRRALLRAGRHADRPDPGARRSPPTSPSAAPSATGCSSPPTPRSTPSSCP